MDRQTRRANFKKLQEPANTKLRSTRSSKATAPMTLSEYFNTQESSSSSAAAEPENLLAEPRSKKARDVEPSKDVVKPKKAPKLKASAPQRRARAGRGKKQPSISDFLRNEQLFAEVTAQHCMADNFSPDDIEMALVLSKSEAEKHGRLRLEDTEDEREEVLDLLDDKANQSTENVRRKLQKYGFRTAAKEDYNLFSIAALPGAPGKRGKRCKWANKFTPLTLRNPEAQQKKLQTKVAALMAQQVRTKLPSAEQQPPFELISERLLQLAASAERRITHEPSAEPLTNLSAYYVQDLFEVSRTPAHHLLKSWSAIQGRDLSPKRPSAASQRRQQQLQQVYAELEAHFGASAVDEELDELEKLVADNMIQDVSQVLAENLVQQANQMADDNIQLPVDQVQISLNSDSPLKEPPDKRARMMPKQSEENLQPSTSAMLSLPTQSTRCISPDLFADSDDDEPASETPATCSTAAALEMQNFSLKVYRNISSCEMNSYEVYSSDEVKIVHDVKAERRSLQAPAQASFIDLTEEQDSPEITSSKSLFEQHIFPQSPSIDFDEDIDVLEQDLSGQAADCEISEELYAKYAYQTARDKAVLERTQSQLDNECLNVSRNDSAKANPTSSSNMATTSHAFKDSILSLSQLDSTRDAFQRSWSLTQSPGQAAQLEQSFKSPLSRRSKSFADKSVLTLSHSDASIDLTQDSGDEDNEEDNVLLSDEEINYSIWKADKTYREALDDSNSLPLTRIKSVPFFKTVEDLDAYLDASPTPSSKSCNSRSPNKSALSKERAEFGILDAAISQPFTLSQLQSSPDKACQVPIDWTDASFLETPPEVPIKRYSSSCAHKFKELLNDISEPADELDDFDRLVFQNSSKDATIDTMPSGLDQLLLGEINAESLPQSAAAVEPPSPAKAATSWEQLELNGQVYEVRVCRTPKPDFVHLSDAELLQQLYNCGIKPLKRKQAVKLLEYIYNQTHPIMLPPAQPEPEPVTMPRSKSTPITAGTGKSHNGRLRLASSDEAEPKAALQFRDAAGAQLLRFSQDAPPALCDDFECFVLQTNVSKKTPQPLLPLHIAWHNLLCANPELHERVLHFEPIDLQEIYLHLKQLGQRYEPKELKSFFDRRCIIFRYELAPPQKQAQRHIRKPKSRRPYARP